METTKKADSRREMMTGIRVKQAEGDADSLIVSIALASYTSSQS